MRSSMRFIQESFKLMAVDAVLYHRARDFLEGVRVDSADENDIEDV